MDYFSLYQIQEPGELPIRYDFDHDLGGVPGGRCVTWGGFGGVLRTEEAIVLRSDSTLAHVVQVPWDGLAPLRLYAGDAKEPVLVVAPN